MKTPKAHALSTWIAIDGGSTNTRAWLMHQNRVADQVSTAVGARDTARTGSPEKLRFAVRKLIAEVRKAQPGLEPSLVAAAGMITSPLGLVEVPHMPVPASVENLARGARSARLPDITDLPFWLFPGVRCGELTADDVSQVDVMRGEETLCIGLLADKSFRPPFTVLNLGSHWKWIRMDESGRIAQSRTSLTGELIHATQSATILASGLPCEKLEELDDSWCERGMAECRRSGLTRGLFCVRLLEMQGHTTPFMRMSFLIGAFVAAELDALGPADQFVQPGRVILAGSGAVARGWQLALAQKQIASRVLEAGEIESAFLAGLGRLVQAAALNG